MMNALPAANFPGAEKKPLSYPGARPEYSYVYYQDMVYKITARGDSYDDLWVNDGEDEIRIDAFLAARENEGLEMRHAVLAVGSNGCPGRLVEKYREQPEVAIPVFVGKLTDTAVVYSRHIAPYGAIPATYLHQPGAVSWLSVNMLTDRQIENMDKTESVGELYLRIAVPGEFEVDGGPRVGGMTAYMDRNIVAYQGKPILLKLFAREYPDWMVMDQTEVLTFVLDQAGVLPGESIEYRNQLLRKDQGIRERVLDYLHKEMSTLKVNEKGEILKD